MHLGKIPHNALVQIPVLEQELNIVSYMYLEGGFFAPLPGEIKHLPHDHLTIVLADRLPKAQLPTDGAPAEAVLFQEIPRFFDNEAGWVDTDEGFYFVDPHAIRGKIRGKKCLLAVNVQTEIYLWQNSQVEFLLRPDHSLHSGIETAELAHQSVIEMGPYYLMRTLLDGILSMKDIHKQLCESIQ